MRLERILNFANVSGLVLSISGVFLPWGKRELVSHFMAWRVYLVGVQLLLGTIALMGGAVAAIFLLLHAKKKQRYWLVPVLLGGLITLFCSLVWISNPNAYAWYWDWHQEYGLVPFRTGHIPYKVLYGAYISLAGSITTSIGAILNFLYH